MLTVCLSGGVVLALLQVPAVLGCLFFHRQQSKPQQVHQNKRNASSAAGHPAHVSVTVY
jgi:hypothetical protein